MTMIYQKRPNLLQFIKNLILLRRVHRLNNLTANLKQVVPLRHNPKLLSVIPGT